MNTRIEHDSMGEIAVSENVYWGAQTQRSLQNFDIGGEILPPAMIQALALVKKTAALTNKELNRISAECADLIVQAAERVLKGELADQFLWLCGKLVLVPKVI